MSEDYSAKLGTELLLESLRDEGVEVIFGYPGGAVLHIYDEFFKQEFNHVLARHEQGSAHMADGYARATGKPGVCIATSGPGATNTVTAVATAQMDSVPLVIITGQVADSAIGKDAFQETDIVGVMSPVTKYTFQVRDAKNIPQIVKAAFHIANTGRKGPVLIDIPKNIGIQVVEHDELAQGLNIPAYNPEIEVNLDQVNHIMKALQKAKRPLILAGAGIGHARCQELFRTFVDRYKIPVTSTLLGIGAMNYHDDLYLGMAGMHGTYAANMALMESDLLINIGSRFDDRVASNPDRFAPDATIVHIDIDASELGKIIRPNLPLQADARQALTAMLEYPVDYVTPQEWLDHQKENKALHPMSVPESQNGEIKPQRVIQYLGEKTDGEATVVADVGQHQMWVAQYYPFRHVGQHLSSGGLGTMGFGIPGAIGAAFAKKDKPVVAIVGDGGFQMTNQELNMIQHYGIKPKFIILNNTVLGMVHQWQHTFYEDRYSHSEFGDALPNFVKLSEALGVTASRVTKAEDLEAAIDKMLAYDGPYVLEVLIDKNELVTPMVPTGKSNDEMEGL